MLCLKALPIVAVATLTNIPLYFSLVITRIVAFISRKRDASRKNKSSLGQIESMLTPEQDPMLKPVVQIN